jgi:hypothetical protein
MQARQLNTGETTFLTVPIDFIREMGIPQLVERNDSTEYNVWVTWLKHREAFAYYFPDPDTPEQPESAIPRRLRVKPVNDHDYVYQVSIPKGALRSRGITEEVLDDGYTVFPELSVEDRVLTIELPRPDDRPNPWAGLGDVTPESPTADWLIEGNQPDHETATVAAGVDDQGQSD